MPHRAEDDPLRASDERFQRRRAELVEELRSLLGPREAVQPIGDADRATSVAAEAVAAHRAARRQGWAVVRQTWPSDERSGLTALLHATSAYVGVRDVWLVVPGREPQAASIASDAVLDNPLGFAELAGGELVLMDQHVPAGVWLLRHGAADGWELEVWGAEPWLSAVTRALREQRPSGGGSG
jgi:hypothetical protein